MKWIEALKKFNAGKGEWCIPRKGSREHKEVLSIMQGATLYTNTRSEKARREKRAETGKEEKNRWLLEKMFESGFPHASGREEG